ncbi:MAG: TetR/AcrR family transcriptional regulator [Planctomycetota bacterium]|nr:MAG: TetR/AcrR family transcriptional regulator [Planctomycetota bacterium]
MKIVEAARELFHVQGFHATSMADILKKSGVNSGSLYYFFKSKDDLLLAVLDLYVDLLRPAVMDAAFATTDDPIERVFAVLAGYREMLVMTGCTLGCPIGNLALELGDSKPDVRAKIALNFTNWCRAIEQCLREADDRLPADLDRERLSRFVLTVMEGGIMQARGHRDVKPYDDAVAQLRDYFDRLLGPSRAAA